MSDSLLGYSAVFVCVGLGLLFLRTAAGNESGPGYWSLAFFLNGAGFALWAAVATPYPLLFFIMGDTLHMFGFVVLVYGVYRFTGNGFRRWNIYVVAGIFSAWGGTMSLIPHHQVLGFVLSSVLRGLIYAAAGGMILLRISAKSIVGRKLAGWALAAWGSYVTLFPLFAMMPSIYPLALGFLVGLNLLAAVGLVILIVDGMRLRAEATEHQVHRLEGLLPICSYCKRIRDENDTWQSIEIYVRDRSDADFSHGICPDCAKTHYPKLTFHPKGS